MLVALATLLSGSGAQAAAFAVSPIKVELSPRVRSAALTVSNNDSVELGFQMKLLRWTQNEHGEDVYEDSKDLVFFPQMMKVAPGDRRVVRVGTQGAAAASEVTYRLAIDEMLPPRKAEQGPQVAVRMRFAVPIFIATAAPEIRADVEILSVASGTLKVRLKNLGNRHVRPATIALMQGERELGHVDGWYVLAGARRDFEVKYRQPDCSSKAPIRLVLTGEQLDLKREVQARLCGP